MKKKIISGIALVIFAGFLGFNAKISIDKHSIDTSLNNLETVAMAQDEWAGWIKGKKIGEVKIIDEIKGSGWWADTTYRIIHCCVKATSYDACNPEGEDYECSYNVN